MISRRTSLAVLSGAVALPNVALAATPRALKWEDLIPPGLPYSEIIGQGELDIENDTWNPIYDANAVKLNEDLNGTYIKIPGFIIPIDVSAAGVTNFMLVPYVGACIHTPPPPANQLVMVDVKKPWPGDQLWDPVWVTGTLSTHLQSTKLGQTGYAIAAVDMETYEW